MIIDIYTHILPDRFFQEMSRVSPKLENIGARLRGVKKLFDLLPRRTGQRDDLPVVAERVHFGETQVETQPPLHTAQPRADVLQLGRDARHLAEERIRKDVRV